MTARKRITYFPYRYTARDRYAMREISKRKSSMPEPPKEESGYVKLLREAGIAVDPVDFAGPATAPIQVETILPSMPVSWSSDGVPQFTTTQLSWAQPEDYGWEVYEVLEGPPPYALSYEEECRIPKRRPPHKYNRVERFRSVLNHLMFGSGDVPPQIIDLVGCLTTSAAGNLWEEVRSILKGRNLRRYYNRIPGILCSAGYIRYAHAHRSGLYDEIMSDFCELHNLFNQKRAALDRVYFPNLRYMCLRLMERHAVVMPIAIPRARTAKKQASLDATYDMMWSLIAAASDDDV